MASPAPTPARIRFDAFELDAASGELRKAGILLKLQPQPFRVFLLLIERAGQVVTREEIQRCLWTDSTFVDFEHGINFSINQIRGALADNADHPRYIETLPKRGYRFIGTVKQLSVPKQPETPIPERMESITVLKPSPPESELETAAPRHWRTIASPPIIVELAKKHKIGLMGGVLITLTVIATAAYGIYSRIHSRDEIPFQDFTSTQLTTNGESALAAIPPDGKYLASIVDDNGKSSLWLRHILTNSDTQVIPPAEVSYGDLAFSPDGSYIYFRKVIVGGGQVDLFRVPVLGGPPQILVKDIDSNSAFSPGGGLIAFVRANPEISIYRLIVANADGTEEKIIASRPYSRYPYAVAWSSDGKRIFGIEQSGAWRGSIVSFDVASGQVRSLAEFDDLLIDNITPTLDEQKFMVLYRSKSSGFRTRQIGVVSLSDSKLRAVTRDTNNYGTMTLSGDRKTLAAVQEKTDSALYLLPATSYGVNAPQQILTRQNDISDFSWASNTEVYVARRGSLFRSSVDGSSNIQLIADPHSTISHVAGCVSGRFAVFTWDGHGESHNAQSLWRVEGDGSSQKQIASGNYDDQFVCSPDGKWIYYAELNSSGIVQVSADGGTRQTVIGTVLPGFSNTLGGPDVSSNGKLLAFNVYGATPSDPEVVDEEIIVSLDSAAEPRTRMILRGDSIRGGSRFTPDGNALVYAAYVDNGSYYNGLWFQPLEGSQGHPIVHFPSGWTLRIQFSPDGQHLGVLRTTHTESDIVLLHDIGNAP